MFLGFSAYIKTITALTIFSTMACMFLPNNSFRKYLELILGVLVISAILQPLSIVFRAENFSLPEWQNQLVIADTLLEEDVYLELEKERMERAETVDSETTIIE